MKCEQVPAQSAVPIKDGEQCIGCKKPLAVKDRYFFLYLVTGIAMHVRNKECQDLYVKDMTH